MSLPAWVENELSRWSSKHGKGYLNVFKALEIAWEALSCYENKHDPVYRFKDPSECAEDALRRIEELGK